MTTDVLLKHRQTKGAVTTGLGYENVRTAVYPTQTPSFW